MLSIFLNDHLLKFLFRDLLSKDGEKLDIKINPDGTGQLHVPGLRVMEVKSFQHIKKVSPVMSSVKMATDYTTISQKIVIVFLF